MYSESLNMTPPEYATMARVISSPSITKLVNACAARRGYGTAAAACWTQAVVRAWFTSDDFFFGIKCLHATKEQAARRGHGEQFILKLLHDHMADPLHKLNCSLDEAMRTTDRACSERRDT
jgi:hypothetical protein